MMNGRYLHFFIVSVEVLGICFEECHLEVVSGILLFVAILDQDHNNEMAAIARLQ
jgi:hypothetical protein